MAGTNIHVVKYEPTDPRLGRHVEHDDRSKMVEHMFAARDLKPKHKDAHWTSLAPPINQLDTGSCTCSSEMNVLNTDFFTAARQEINGHPSSFFTQQDALDLYALATKLDAFPGFYPEEDTGSSGNAAAKASVRKKWLTSYSWLFSFSSLQATIERRPLTIGTLWTNKMFDCKNGIVTVGSLADSNIAGGHQYAMTGIVWNDGLFEFRNTWGDQDEWPGCKPGGYFAMSFSDVRSLQEADGDVTVQKYNN
jgi:hypothetical protein